MRGVAEVVALGSVAATHADGVGAGGHRHCLQRFIALKASALTRERGHDVAFKRHLNDACAVDGPEFNFYRRRRAAS